MGLGLVVVLILILFGAYKIWFSPTKVAFVNYQVITLGQISKANDNPFVKIRELGTDDWKRIKKFDMVFINAMGLRITEDQREYLVKATDKGLSVLTTAATNPANNIVSVSDLQADVLTEYITNGGRHNYRSMLGYVRRYVDKKKVRAPEPDAVLERSYDMMYHADSENPDNDDLGFNSVREYNAFLLGQGLWDEKKPAVVITGVMGEPTELIAKLEETGDLAYPVNNMNAFVNGGHIDSVNVAAVVNMAHGRMGDYIVDYLSERNVPLFAPLNINRLVEDWEADKQGMNGGFLSQSVVTPEIDGAIRPYALFGNYIGSDGLQHSGTIPGRLDTFVQTINNYISLQQKPNSQKRVAIYYFKGPGENALTASGMEVVPSLYNLLLRFRREGYDVGGLPSSAKELEKMIQKVDEFGPDVARLQFGNVALLPQVAAGTGDNSFKVVHGTEADPPQNYIDSYLWTQQEFKADALIHFGTHGSLEFTPSKQVALSSDDWPDRLVGALPHFYVYTIGNVGEAMNAKRRSYAGIQSHLTPPFMESELRGTYKELSDAIQTYYSLEPDEDVAPTASVRDALLKASLKVKKLTVQMGIHRELGLDSLLTEPYTEEDIFRIEEFAEEIANTKITGQLYTMGVPYEASRITSSVYAMTTEPIAYSLYALDKERGRASAGVEKHKAEFTKRYINPAKELVGRLLANPSAGTDELVCRTAGITAEELSLAREIDESRNSPMDMMSMMMSMASQMPGDAAAHADNSDRQKNKDKSGAPSSGMMKMMQKLGKNMTPEKALEMARKMGAPPEALKRMKEAMEKSQQNADSLGVSAEESADEIIPPDTESPDESSNEESGGDSPDEMDATAMMQAMMGGNRYTKEEINFAQAVMEVERAIKNVGNYKKALLESPEAELASLMNALNGGYTKPSPGGDPIANPNTLPTGRNLFAINAEETPSEAAWEKGKLLADNTIAMYKRQHNDSIPRKVSYTLWSSEFIETGGATIAQVLYMLGVEPIRDAFGRVTDLRLIPSAELGRPRIDVVVQTSGQLRDLAASRLFLINRAVEMAAAAKDDVFENQVAEGVVEAERVLIDKGLTPKDAREISTYRVFGGVNGGYGTGIQGMVQAGDRWENESEIADVYLNNMGAFYGSEKNWEIVRQYAFEAALTSTDVVVQPRQSNTWGALSLDHVYEFMGGMNLAVRNVTGKDPDAYLSDYRNRNHARMQEVKEAIGVESRSTIFNPAYIQEKMKGGATSAESFTEIVENTYGWNVMKPQAIDGEMWDEIYNVYVQDKFGLGVQDYFEEQNPYALQNMTGVMMETARKGYWAATEQQLQTIAQVHTELVKKYGASGSTFTTDNIKLQDFIASNVNAQQAQEYRQKMKEERESVVDDARKGVVMKKETVSEGEGETNLLNGGVVVIVVLAAFILLLVVLRKKRSKNKA